VAKPSVFAASECPCTDPGVIRDFNRMIYNQCVKFVAAEDPEHISFHAKRSER